MPHKHYPIMLDVGAMNKTMPDPLDRKVRMDLPLYGELRILTRRELLHIYGTLTRIEGAIQISNAQGGGAAGNHDACNGCPFQSNNGVLRDQGNWCEATIEEAIAIPSCAAIDWDDARNDACRTLETVYRVRGDQLASLRAEAPHA